MCACLCAHISACVCIMCVQTCVYTHAPIYIYMCMPYTHVYTTLHTCAFIMCAHVYPYMCSHVHIYAHVCISVMCMRVHSCVYTHLCMCKRVGMSVHLCMHVRACVCVFPCTAACSHGVANVTMEAVTPRTKFPTFIGFLSSCYDYGSREMTTA